MVLIKCDIRIVYLPSLIMIEIFDMSNALSLSDKDEYSSAIVKRTNVLMQLKFKLGFEFQET